MFRSLKKRLASASSPNNIPGGSDNGTGGAGAGATGSGGGTSSVMGGGGIGGGRTDDSHKSKFRVTLRKASKESQYDVARLKSKVTHLASFDACVEAADALAAQVPYVNSSSSNNNTDVTEGSSTLSTRRHEPSGLPDPSVLVSVDGNLLLIPPLDDPRSVFLKNQTKKDQLNPPSSPKTNTTNAVHDSTHNDKESNRNTNNDAPMFSTLMTNGKDDYASAVYLGNDIVGDKHLNGFSAMGWSLPATSHALGQTESSLHNLVLFAENILLHRKEAAAKTSQTCDELRAFMPSLGGTNPVPMTRTSRTRTNSGPSSRSNSNASTASADDWEIVDPRANEFVPSISDRTGPMSAPTSSLNQALVILEEYFSKTSELDSEYWREVSTKKGSMLPKLQEAYHRVSQRVQNREDALEQASQRARLLEERLQGLRKEAEQKWGKVYKTEEKVQARIESLWQERSRQRERARLDQLHKENEAAAMDMQQQPSVDIMNLVAQISEDGGSFEPMELGSRTPEKKKETVMVDNLFAKGEGMPPPPALTAPGLAAISRDEVEQEFRLDELRASAFAADERVEDAAQDLLLALSNLDTTRRAARVVAETTLVSAGNAQVQSIREFVSVERKAIEQKLKLVEKLEKSLASVEINVRDDLDVYIAKDKKERGGKSHLGDDDDGGIASALAVLSSHVDKQGEGEPRSVDEPSGNDDPLATREDLIAALDSLFVCTEQPIEVESSSEAWDVDKAVELLCSVAAAPNSRSQRSTICYALNSKRSTSAEIPSLSQFEGLCRVFDSVLASYVTDDTGMANAKMLMMLAQTFYFLDTGLTHDNLVEASPSRPKREKRVYVRIRLTGHPIWSNDAFWDEAFRTAMSESLTVSGVMSNFERSIQMVHANKDYSQSKGRMMKWYDLNYEERIGAASQVHAVICAQLGALAHSMIEFGCGLERSCAFVRRTAIRNQLPTWQRTMLLQHLMKRQNLEIPKL